MYKDRIFKHAQIDHASRKNDNQRNNGILRFVRKYFAKWLSNTFLNHLNFKGWLVKIAPVSAPLSVFNFQKIKKIFANVVRSQRREWSDVAVFFLDSTRTLESAGRGRGEMVFRQRERFAE